MMAADHASESAALAYALDIHELLAIEDINQHTVADLGAITVIRLCRHFDSDFAENANRRQIVLRQMSEFSLVQLRFLDHLDKPDLCGIVSVFRRCLTLGDDARPCLDHGCGTYFTIRIEQLRHPDFFSNNSDNCHFLFSPSSCPRALLADGTVGFTSCHPEVSSFC